MIVGKPSRYISTRIAVIELVETSAIKKSRLSLFKLCMLMKGKTVHDRGKTKQLHIDKDSSDFLIASVSTSFNWHHVSLKIYV